MSKLSLIFFLIVLLAIVEMGSTVEESDENSRNNSKPIKDESGKGSSEESESGTGKPIKDESGKSEERESGKGKPKKDESGKGKPKKDESGKGSSEEKESGKGKPKKDESGKGNSEESESENSSDDSHKENKHSDEHGETHESGNNSVDTDEDDFKPGNPAEESDKDKYNKDVDHGHGKNGICTNGDDKCKDYQHHNKSEYIFERNKHYPKCHKQHPDAQCISIAKICEHKNYQTYATTAHGSMQSRMTTVCDCQKGNYIIIETTKWENKQYHTSTDVYRMDKVVGSKDIILTSTAKGNKDEDYLHKIRMRILYYGDDMMVMSLCSDEGTYPIDLIYGAVEETRLCEHKNGMKSVCAMCKMETLLSVLYSKYNLAYMTKSKQIC